MRMCTCVMNVLLGARMFGGALNLAIVSKPRTLPSALKKAAVLVRGDTIWTSN